MKYVVEQGNCVTFFDEVTYCFVNGDEELKMYQMNDLVEMYWHDGTAYTTECQRKAEWHLTEISSRYSNQTSYAYDTPQLKTKVYILDTWVQTDHFEFEGRASRGPAFEFGEGPGHGTHVAGIVGSKTYGVNKQAQIVSVQVLNQYGTGAYSNIIKGVQWVSTQSRYNSIINMSIGGPKSEALNQILNMMQRYGWKIVVAAGNENQDACQSSPSGSDGVITVGAYDHVRNFASFSNWGKCVDILAPGVGILSTYPYNQAAYISGTSMASPIVAGIWSLKPSMSAQALLNNALEERIRKVPFTTRNLAAYAPHQQTCPKRSLWRWLMQVE